MERSHQVDPMDRLSGDELCRKRLAILLIFPLLMSNLESCKKLHSVKVTEQYFPVSLLYKVALNFESMDKI